MAAEEHVRSRNELAILWVCLRTIHHATDAQAGGSGGVACLHNCSNLLSASMASSTASVPSGKSVR